jgi:RNA polymerase sigma factor (sigma-70 family)
MAVMIDDPHFRNFASSLEAAIERCGETEDEDFLTRQKRQVDTLVALEKEFKETVIASAHGERVYAAFVKFICDDRRNILDARPYFRERQGTFTQQISKALRRRSPKALYRFRFNFRFVQFVMNSRAWKPRSMVARLANQIRAIRDELITMNMPLAISRARIFYSRTPKAHLAYMDLIQIACEGLMSGIDKFVPPFSKAFRAVAIGRMTGNFIEQYSETFIHFYPPDKRKIYRGKKLLGRQVDVGDFDELAQRVNTNQEGGQVEPLHRTNAAEIANLMAAASTVSTDTPISDDDEETVRVADRFAAPADCQPDVIYERTEKMRQLVDATATLTPFEQKVLRLKGVSF